MLLVIQVQWTKRPTGSFGGQWDGVGKQLDTSTNQIIPYTGFYNQALLDPDPTNIPPPAVGDLLYVECSPAPDFDRTSWFYAAGNTVTTTVDPNSTLCGWLPPPPPLPACSLQLTLAVTNGDTIVATASGGHGTLAYSLDGGLTRQASPRFGPLVAGAYTVTAYDPGAFSCQASASVTLAPTTPAVVPTAGVLPAVGFSRNPLPLAVQASAPGRALLLELYIELSHGANQYRRLTQRVRPTDVLGQAVFQLQDQLHPVLLPTRPDLSQPLSLRRLRSSIRRYFATLAEVQPATGAPGPAVTLPTSTVLRGGLAWAPARNTSFFTPLPADFLTWRPATEQLVGRQHVVLLAALVAAAETQATLRVQAYRRGATAPFQTLTDVLPLPGLMLGQPATPCLVQAQVPLGALLPDAYRVEVALEVAGAVQASRRYRLDDTYRHRQYVFLNSLGQWDTISCTGPLTSKASVERTVATYLVPADYDPVAGAEGVVDTTLDARLSVSTGAIGPEELEYLRELALSHEVYEVAADQQLRKIRLTSKDLLDYQDNAGADGFAFEYVYCFDTTLYDHARVTHL
jgi:hypothetical protein